MRSEVIQSPCSDGCTAREFIARMTQVFPFAFVIDESLKIIASGHLLERACPQVLHHPQLSDCFRFAQDSQASFGWLAERAGELMVLQNTAALPPFRGQWLRVAKQQMIFLGWPWVTSFGQLSGMGVTLSDIPPHHALAEMLMLLQTNRNAMEDARDLASRIRERNSELEKLTRELRRQAYHDALTGLPNRLMLRERLSHAIARARRQQSRLAVQFIDLDRFKSVNDSLGHRVGDQLLHAVAERLRNALRETDTVAREGGMNFSCYWRI